MNAGRKSLPHDITLDEQEAYSGNAYWRPSDRSVQSAVQALIDAHSDEFQDLIDAQEEARIENEHTQRRIDAAEYAMEDR